MLPSTLVFHRHDIDLPRGVVCDDVDTLKNSVRLFCWVHDVLTHSVVVTVQVGFVMHRRT